MRESAEEFFKMLSWRALWRKIKQENKRFCSCSPAVEFFKMLSWRALWRKIKQEKKRFCSCSPAVHHVQYDPDSYSQNFDDGYSTDPDNASRSFSARFAVPSKIFEKSEVVRDHKRNIMGS